MVGIVGNRTGEIIFMDCRERDGRTAGMGFDWSHPWMDGTIE